MWFCHVFCKISRSRNDRRRAEIMADFLLLVSWQYHKFWPTKASKAKNEHIVPLVALLGMLLIPFKCWMALRVHNFERIRQNTYAFLHLLSNQSPEPIIPFIRCFETERFDWPRQSHDNQLKSKFSEISWKRPINFQN